MNMPPIVSPEEWDAAREELLVKEKEHTRARDALAAERRRMPRMAVEKDYAFEGPDGPASLSDLFAGAPPAGRLPLLLRARRIAAGPSAAAPAARSWPTRSPHLAHLNARDTTLVFVSRAPQDEIARWKARMGWEPSRGTRSPTTSTRTSASPSGTARTRSYRDDDGGSPAPTSSTSAATRRMGSTWAYLDVTALGRQEEWEDSPEGYPQTAPYGWWNRHDEYDAAR